MTFVREPEEDWMEKNVDQYDSETEEVLSFCDLPLGGGGDWEDLSNSKEEHRRSTDQELFEFFNDLNSDMSSAEDIIFCGKLLPYRAPSFSDHSHRCASKNEDQCLDFPRKSFFHHRSDSLSELQRSQSNAKGRFFKNSYSLDYRKLHRVSSSKTTRTKSQVPANDRISAGNCFGKCDSSVRRLPVSSSPAKPRWHLLMFGLIRTPPEMELRDIKNRQSRRGPSTLFPNFEGREKVSVKRNRGSGKGSWSFLRALGCTGHANAVVTASLGCIPHV